MTWVGTVAGSTLTVIRGQVDTRTEQWTEASRHDIAPVLVDPTGSSETPGPTGTEDALQVDATVFAPYGADVVATDRALIDGDATNLYDVAGSPQQWRNPFSGDPAGCVIRLVHHQG